MKNKKDIPVSRNAIRGISKYLVLPLIYILIAFMVVPSKVIERNTYTVAQYDSYRTA